MSRVLLERRDAKPLASRLLDGLALANEGVVTAALFADLVVTFCNTIGRYGFGAGLQWSTDFSLICLAAIAFLGSAGYYRRGSGMAYTALVDAAGRRTREALGAMSICITIGVCAVSLAWFPPVLRSEIGQSMPVLGVSGGFAGIWLGIGLILTTVFALEKLARLPLRAVLPGLAAALLLGLVSILLQQWYATSDVALGPMVPVSAILAISFLVGTPIAFVLALGGILYFLVSGAIPLVAVPSAYQAGIGSFVLLAIPFFMVAGALMDVTGMAARLIDMVQEWVGHWRGGLLLGQVVAMYIFSGMSGSKGADMATVGGIMRGPLRERGYRPAESVAVLAAAAAMGEIVPPSVALLILGSITTLSVGALFIAGIVPAALLALSLALCILWRARSHGFPKGPPFHLPRALRSIWLAAPALMVPLIIIGSIVGGVASPTEASSFAVVYGLLAAAIVYRSIRPDQAWPALRDATLMAGMVLFMVSAANLLSQAIVIDGMGLWMASAFATLESKMAFLLLSMGALVVIGFVLEGFPAILIAAPILLPVARHMAIDELQYGILLVIAIGIGVFMPPIGIGYYVACAIGEAPPSAAMRPSLVYTAFLLAGLVVAVLFPGITLGLPHLLGFR